jgi:NAD(P)-dependent dehydrogenase (short-subunit alcohol dehydrogenase family)
MQIFRDKVVLITGGSSGIGRATALRLASYGAKVAVAARNQKRLDEVAAEAAAAGAQAMAVPTDVSIPDDCERAVETTVEHFGGLDILISSAGLSLRSYFEGSDLEVLERVVFVNFFGTMYMTHYALPHIKRTKGSLVAMSSMTGMRGIPSYAIYGASKFAVQGFYESLRLELKREGVHVGVVSPGFVDTPLRNRVLNRRGETWDQPPPLPFRLWPTERIVDLTVRLIARRRAQAVLPWYIKQLSLLDRLIGSWIGNWLLRRRFPPV